MLNGKMVHRLIYRSRQTTETAADLDVVAARLIDSAIRGNRRFGLTGLLLAAQSSFVQALEGDADKVRAMYARILRDPRHYDIQIIWQGPAKQRLFTDWNMCARCLAPTDRLIVEVIDDWSGFDPETLTARSAERLLTAISAVQHRVALEVQSDKAASEVRRF